MRYNNEQKELTFEQTKDKALRLLEFRAHSERELTDKLKRAGAKDNNIEEVLEFCRNYGFVDDRSFAVKKARDLKNLKRYGIRRIKSELYSKGIAAEYIEEAVAELDDNEEMLIPLVEKKLGGNFEKKNVDKCIRYFIYRGYSFSDIKNCIDELKIDYEE
ncbi:regulatory protein RecX [Lachnospiraceae bacterium MD329]|jgi:regulatory protein|nr:regulatory protein RecX [Lachnospiraceae bacterium MD329]